MHHLQFRLAAWYFLCLQSDLMTFNFPRTLAGCLQDYPGLRLKTNDNQTYEHSAFSATMTII